VYIHNTKFILNLYICICIKYNVLISVTTSYINKKLFILLTTANMAEIFKEKYVSLFSMHLYKISLFKCFISFRLNSKTKV
jgi:hypothetical protein